MDLPPGETSETPCRYYRSALNGTTGEKPVSISPDIAMVEPAKECQGFNFGASNESYSHVQNWEGGS